jgi:hypothetical protein
MDMDCGDIVYIIFSLIFIIAVAAGVILGIFLFRYLFAIAGGAWLIYQFMCCCNSQTRYVWNV